VQSFEDTAKDHQIVQKHGTLKCNVILDKVETNAQLFEFKQ
jgi:hypothetical protein